MQDQNIPSKTDHLYNSWRQVTFSSSIFYFLYLSQSSQLQRPQASSTMKAGHRQTSQTHGDERGFKA